MKCSAVDSEPRRLVCAFHVRQCQVTGSAGVQLISLLPDEHAIFFLLPGYEGNLIFRTTIDSCADDLGTFELHYGTCSLVLIHL